jgi:hypothetical protein
VGQRRRDDSIWLALAAGLLYAGYIVLRYRGLWTENDTSLFSRVTFDTLRAGSVLFPGQYSHGYGYPAWSAMLAAVTGLAPAPLESDVLPYVGVLFLVLSALALFTRLLGSRRLAATATLLLLLAPDVMFSAVRGNHEKLNIALLLLSLYGLLEVARCARQRRRGTMVAWVGLFLFCTFLNASINDYFASSFALAETLALLLLRFFYRRDRSGWPAARSGLRAVTWTVLASWPVIAWVMLAVFPPEAADLQLLHSAAQKLAHLFLSLHGSSNPFAAVAQQWAGRGAAAAVAAFRYVLALGSGLAWAAVALAAWRLRGRRHRRPERLLLLAAYVAFAASVAVAIPVDFTGLGAGANLEVRNFTYFGLLAAPIFVLGMHEVSLRLRARRLRRQRMGEARPAPATWYGGAARAGAAVLAAAFLLVSLLKVTLDPVVSNQWVFYTPAEGQALDAFLHRAVDQALWTGPDDRLPNVAGAFFPSVHGGDQVVGYAISKRPQIRDLLISPAVIDNCLVQQFPIPYVGDMNRIYDDGGAQIYRYAPETIFED